MDLRILVGGCLIAAAACDRDPAPAAAARGRAPLYGHAIADVAAKATPSVVNVFSERDLAASDDSPFYLRERGLGSGVIVGADGVILTNNHLVEHADKVRVGLLDGRELDAKVVGTDPQSDIAVLRVDARELPAIEIADSSKIRVGDVVLAVGDPFGLGQTVTMGIISALGRANMGITDDEDFIQTDAAINPGNSGGALVDMDGKLIGINTALASRSGGYMGIGFAIPSNMAIEVEKAILANGKVTRGWLGVAIRARVPRHGVLVTDVADDGPAAKAGIARGDVIATIDGAKTDSPSQLRNAVALAGKGKRVRIELERHDVATTVDATLGDVPSR